MTENQPPPTIASDPAAGLAEQQQRRQAAQEAEARAEALAVEALARANADHQARQAEAMREQRTRLEAYETALQRQAEEARQEEERKRERAARGQQAEGEIREAGDRYRVALAQNYDIKDPYGSLARAAMAEYGAFVRDREQLRAQIAREQDPEARQALELRQEIQTADYMAITSRRIAAQSVTITGRRDNEEAVQMRDRAAGYEAKGAELREQYRELAGRAAVQGADQAKGQQQDDQARDSQPPQRTTREDIDQPAAARLMEDAQRRMNDPRIIKEEKQLAAEQAKQAQAENQTLNKRLDGVPADKQKQERDAAQQARKAREARERADLLTRQRQREARERQRAAQAGRKAKGRSGDGDRGGMEL